MLEAPTGKGTPVIEKVFQEEPVLCLKSSFLYNFYTGDDYLVFHRFTKEFNYEKNPVMFINTTVEHERKRSYAVCISFSTGGVFNNDSFNQYL